MSVIHNDDVRHQVKHYLDKIATKRMAKLAITNDQRAIALGLYIDKNGNIAFPKGTRGADQKSGAIRTSWPAGVK